MSSCLSGLGDWCISPAISLDILIAVIIVSGILVIILVAAEIRDECGTCLQTRERVQTQADYVELLEQGYGDDDAKTQDTASASSSSSAA
jgi:hypothetical protein